MIKKQTKMKPTKLQTKIVRIVMILLIPLLLFSVALLIDELIKSDKTFLYGLIISTIFIIYILIFIVFLIFMLTKYKRKFEMGEGNIPYFRVFTFSLFVFMIIVGLIDILIFKTWEKVHILIIGLALLINQIILNKKYKKVNLKY